MQSKAKEWLKAKEGIDGEFAGRYYMYNVLGLPHIGRGHLVKNNESFPNGLSLAEVDSLFDNDIAIFENAVRAKNMMLNENQVDALTLWLFRTGAVNSDLFKVIAENLGKDNQKIKDWWGTHYITAQNSNDTHIYDDRIKYELSTFFDSESTLSKINSPTAQNMTAFVIVCGLIFLIYKWS